ncbi:MAG: hypothetical protein KGR46_00645 [Verrucomicrobia bacterium]|nr:hypothetical protein [Verrucomicrobiota bacterium]
MRLLIVAIALSITLAGGLPSVSANGNVYVSRFWHNHQPLYWPEWNSNGAQTLRGQYAQDSITLKPGQNYGGISPKQHPENDLVEIFGKDDRRNAYQFGPKNSVSGIDSRGGFAISYSGSLIDNVRQLGGGGHLGYQGNWNQGIRDARGWKTPAGSTRMDMLGFTYHHSLGPLLPKSVFRKEIQTFKQAWWKAWGGNSNLSDHSKGFFPTEMGYSRHLIDILVDEGFEWTLVASHHISRTSPSYNDRANPQGAFNIYSSPPNKADQISPTFPNADQWWYGEPNPGNAAWNVAPFAYQLHRVKYVNPETGVEKKMYAVPSDDVLSYRYGYANEGVGKIDGEIAPHANVPVIVIPSTDGDNAWGGGASSWGEATSQLFGDSANRGYKPSTPQDFVNAVKGSITSDTHIEDGAWIFPEMCYGSPNFLKWIEPPVATVANRGVTTHPGTQVDMETPGFALKFFSYAPLMAGANWLETAEQVLAEENGGNDMVNEWKIATPYDWDGSWTSPNDVELAWHIYLKGLDSGFNYYGGLGNDDEVKPALATKNAIDKLQNFMTPARKAKDKVGPTVLKPQRFPYNPGWFTFGWFNNEPHINNSNFLKKMPSWFYIWTHAYDLNGIPDGNVKLKIRIDVDGNNPLNTNQNETYAGGSEVGNWVTVNMTKRVLPKTRTALNAAAANGQIDYFVFDPAFWANPVIADYYFAKIDDTSLPNFRDKLLDYYIEATDSLGNVHKSEIQHVWVANDGLTPSSGVTFSANPSDCEPITVTYTATNGPLEGMSPVTMQISFDGGATWTPYSMNSTSANVWTHTISAPNNAPSAIVWFQSGSTIDSRNGQNWTVTVRDCDAPQGPVWTVPFTPVAGQPVTVYYNPTGRNLASATTVFIHHGINTTNPVDWTTPPGVPMTKDGSNWKFTYTVPQNATIVRYVFNNNAGTWDNNGGGNWNINVNSQPPPTEAPPAPTGLIATATSSTSVTLSWNASANATGYTVFRNGAQIAAPTDRNLIDSGLTAETAYSYFVRARNAVGNSTASSTVSVTTPFAPVAGNNILILEPASLLEVGTGNYTFRGRAGGNFTAGLRWTNNATGQNGTIAFPGGSVANGWEWTASIPLALGPNSISFTGLIESAGNQTLTDTPATYTTFSANATGGQGFGQWYFDHVASGGAFLADNPANMNVGTTKGWGLWANNGGRAAITRSFITPMKSGDSFNVKFDNNWINNGSEVGMELRAGNGTVRLRFSFIGGENNYRVRDAAGNRTTTIAYTANGTDLNLSLGTGNAYTLNTSSGIVTGNLTAGDPITWIEFFNNNSGPDTPYNLYIGAMTHTVATTGNQTITQNSSITRIADSNTDGLPNSWWSGYNITELNRVASADPDADGFTNAQEHALGTDPTSAASRFSAQAPERNGNSVTLNWSAVAGKRYQVQAKADLTDAWSDVGSAFTANGPTGTQSVTIPSGSTKHFFRVRLVP